MDTSEYISKTLAKKLSHDKQKLGQTLADLPAELFSKLELDEELDSAFREWRKIRSHEGKRRQLQFIGKLMRSRDDAPLQAQLDLLLRPRVLDTKLHKRAEAWRDALLLNDAQAIAELAQLPANTQEQARKALSPAQGEARQSLYGQHSRSLFKALREGLDLLQNQSKASHHE